jgi:hypothetical protein
VSTDGATESKRAEPKPASAAPHVVFVPEPGACAGRLDPDQTLVPLWLASLIDFHVWPSVPTPDVLSGRARTVCEHIDWELIGQEHPELFKRRQQVGAPDLPALWEAKAELADTGTHLAFDVQLEDVDGELALAIYGAGVIGRLDDVEWHAVAALLTTCSSTIHEPRDDVDVFGSILRPARPPAVGGKRTMPAAVQPENWQVGDWMHTWWGYPVHGTLRPGCSCTAHTAAAAAVQFGPGLQASA